MIRNWLVACCMVFASAVAGSPVAAAPSDGVRPQMPFKPEITRGEPADDPGRIASAIYSDWKTVSGHPEFGHACAIRRPGALYCWGWNGNGQIGDGTRTERLRPKRIGTLSDWKVVDTGSGFTCAIRGPGLLYCWGTNGIGELGDGTSVDRLRPRRVGEATNWRTVSAGWGNTCAIKGSGALYCWGWNLDGGGENGDEGGTYRYSPARYSNAIDWRSVSAGMNHTCAIRGSGALYCWGWNHHGQLGDGTYVQRSGPRRIGSLADWKTVAAGAAFTCGMRGGVTFYCWSIGGRPYPFRVSSMYDWKTVRAGYSVEDGGYICAIRSSAGYLYCGHDSPLRLRRFAASGWKSVTATGYDSGCGIRGSGALYCWEDSGANSGQPPPTPRRI